MFAQLFDELTANGMRRENIHIPDGYVDPDIDPKERAAILEKRAGDYEDLIHKLGPIDIQILGIGTNGHIGFAEPGFPFDRGTSIIELAENTRKDNAIYFLSNGVPHHAITMGIRTILESKQIFLLATGPKKNEIVHRMLKEAISTALPATALRLHPKVTLFLDKRAYEH